VSDILINYIGQSCRTYHTKYAEYAQDFHNNHANTGFSQRMLNTGDNHGNIEKVMTIIKPVKSGQYLNSLEKYHIHKIMKQHLQLIGSQIEYQNPTFDVINKYFK
jgi:cation transport regulator ChaC